MKGILSASCFATILAISALVPAPSRGANDAGPELRLSVRGSFDVPAARAGDTVRYRVRVEWEDVPAAVMLLPTGRLETPGFEPAGASVLHRKMVAGEKTLNVTEYVYNLVPGAPGTSRITPFALRYRNGLTGRDESVSVPGASLEIAPARVPLARRPLLWVAACLVAAVAVAAGLRKAARARKRLPAPPAAPAESPVSAGIASLRARCANADARAWAADAERLCTLFLCDRLGIARPGNVRFEAALDRYLERRPAIGPETKAGWSALRELFHEARYAGARREPHALIEACRHLKICLNPSEGIEHGQPVSA